MAYFGVQYLLYNATYGRGGIPELMYCDAFKSSIYGEVPMANRGGPPWCNPKQLNTSPTGLGLDPGVCLNGLLNDQNPRTIAS